MRVPLEKADDSGAVARLTGRLRVEAPGDYLLRYATRTGALLRLDGDVAGAFDLEHHAVRAELSAGEHEVALDVERSSMPTSGLPANPGFRWRMMLALSHERPRLALDVDAVAAPPTPGAPREQALELIGHAHLDVAWLWTYAETRRKAARTFATAVNLLETDPRFVFTQSQPQLYHWVHEGEPALFARVQALARTGRFDASGAAMWVEPDVNIPSGESLLRQLAFGIRHAERELGTPPTVAWLPDSFGFPNTLPALLRHAGVECFATTKLRWNDTTTFPYARFAWEAPDGSRVLAAVFAAYEGDVTKDRVALAERRHEPLVVGYSDGGGGPTDGMVAAGSQSGRWTALGAWFARAAAENDELPVVRDELYLEYHRGIYTTHHDIKARNAALERALGRAELALAWMTVLHATPFFLDEARTALHEAWEIALRNQFHDVIPGTSIEAVYGDAHAEYDRADALVERVLAFARTSLPHFARSDTPGFAKPRRDGDAFIFENAYLSARVRSDGDIAFLGVPGGDNLVHEANVLRAYEDRPAKWEAWNVDRGYEHKAVEVESLGGEAATDGVFARFRIGSSFAAARISLGDSEPFLRVDVAVDWRERRTLLRCENRLALDDARAFFGSPHGVVERTTAPRREAERAKFEACGQRFARVSGRSTSGPGSVAILTLDTYGWSVGPAPRGGVALGHSLLRGTTWPDPRADAGEHTLAYAFLPSTHAGNGALEALWARFSESDGQPALFRCEDLAVAVVATKPADDGDGVIVRVRECDGTACDAAIGVATRATGVSCTDALERPAKGDVALVDGTIVTRLQPYEMRTFRVTFT